MKILVTGGAGFIGSNVADGYVEAGHDVLVVDNLSTGFRSNVHGKARLYSLDIRSPEVAELIKRERPSVVNHHAAQISVPVSVSDPRLDADININGLLNLLEASVQYGVRKFIFISSGGAIYGAASEYPTTENYSPQPLSPYGVSKYTSELYLAYYGHQYGLDYTTLRYANVYGPRQVPHGEAGVVAIFIENLLKGKPSTLYHFPEDEEGMVRDYCYVGDVVKANLRALEKGSGDAFNIGTGLETKTLGLYRTIYEVLKEAGVPMPEEFFTPSPQSARPGDLPKSSLVANKARIALGWVPETGLREGIRETVKWRLAQAD